LICFEFADADPNSRTEIFCNQEPERFVPENGAESSLLLELNPGRTLNSCKRIFHAPESHGFFVHLQKGNSTADFSLPDSENLTTIAKKLQNSTPKKINTTSFCPISVVSIQQNSNLNFLNSIYWTVTNQLLSSLPVNCSSSLFQSPTVHKSNAIALNETYYRQFLFVTV
jgi:hypothetical protein